MTAPTADRIRLQPQFAPQSTCFGCGPANPKGLRIVSEALAGPEGADGPVIARWRPESHHSAFPGILNGGIIGALLDCHSNWAAAYAIMRRRGEAAPPCTVTADFHVKLLRPTPATDEVTLEANVMEILGSADEPGGASRAIVEATLASGGKVCATCRGTFVAVKPGHPAFHRW